MQDTEETEAIKNMPPLRPPPEGSRGVHRHSWHRHKRGTWKYKYVLANLCHPSSVKLKSLKHHQREASHSDVSWLYSKIRITRRVLAFPFHSYVFVMNETVIRKLFKNTSFDSVREHINSTWMPIMALPVTGGAAAQGGPRTLRSPQALVKKQHREERWCHGGRTTLCTA